MKYIFRIVIAALAASLFLTSCKKDDTIRYNNVTMGNFVDGKFVSDQGNEFTIVENLSGTEINNISRAIMQCDVLKKVEGTENGYEVRVHYLSQVLDKKPVETTAAAEDPEKLVTDPITIQQLWISGGYLNMYVLFEIQTYPEKLDRKHLVNLIFNEEEQGKGKYNLYFRHNSYGETLSTIEEEETEDNTVQVQGTEMIQWGLAGAYVSFPLSEIITDKEATLKLNWNEHIFCDNVMTAESVERSVELSYSKDNFEHAPTVVKSKTVVLE